MLAIAVFEIGRAVYIEYRPYNDTAAVYVMAANETLWDIANHYMDKQDKYRDVRYLIDDIRRANNLSDGGFIKRLPPGRELVIPLKVAP